MLIAMENETPSKTSNPTQDGTSQPLRRILASGCINGPAIRWNQTNIEVVSPIWDRWVAEDLVVQFCAELAAGFPIPRPPAEISRGIASEVFIGTAVVVEDTGRDVTDQFIDGAQRTVQYALKQGCVAAVLTDGSPSCGSSYTYDGSFSGSTYNGMGVVAQLLTDNGIKVFPETRLEEADAYLRDRTT